MGNARPKVLQIISGRDLNGAQTYCKFLVERLVQDGYDQTVLCRPDCWLRSQSIPGVHFLESELKRCRSEFSRISDWVRQHQIDLIHTHMSSAHSFAVILRMMTGVPVIATAHSCKFQLHWKLNDFVIANSRSTLNFHRRVNWVGSSLSDVVYCFTNLDRFQHVSPTRVQQVRRHLRVCDDDYLVGVVGQIAPRKGQLYLLRALPRMLAKVPHLKVALLGPYHPQLPYVQQLRAILMRQGLAGRVKWVGPKDNVQDYMQAFDVCVVPSLQEPLGLVAVEALAAGTPVVASRTGGLPEIVTHEATGLLVPRKNSDALSDAIVRLAGDPDLARQLAARGRAQVLQRFQPQELTRQVEAIYERVVANAKHRAGWQSMSGAGLTSPSSCGETMRPERVAGADQETHA